MGFISADGYITKSSQYESWRLSINLEVSDKQHLELFKNCIDSTAPIIEFVNENSKSFGVSKQALMRVNSKKVCSDLMSLGIFQNKSKSIKLPNIPSHLYSHYIRGFVDGDGSFSFTKRKGCDGFRFGFELVGSSLEILKSIQTIFSNNNIKSNIYQRKNKDIYRLMIASKSDISKLIYFLYDDATIYLKRKFDKSHELLQLAVQGRNALNNQRAKSVKSA